MLGAPTLAVGLGEVRARGRRIPSALERRCGALDGAAAVLRHQGEAEAFVARLRRWLADGAVPRAGRQENDFEEVLGSDGKIEEAVPEHRVELGTQVETVELEPRRAEGQFEQKSTLRELLGERVLELHAVSEERKQRIADTRKEKEQLVQQLNHEEQKHNESKERIKQVEHEAKALANMVGKQRMKYAQPEKAMDEQHEIASLAEVPVFPALHIVGEVQSRDVERQQQRDDDAQETNGHPLSSTEGQGRQRSVDEAKVDILDDQLGSTGECTQGAFGNLPSIVKNQGSPQHAYANEKSNGEALSVQARRWAAQTNPERREQGLARKEKEP
ncbi:unnamed protein product [Prorocentrum cordatum]|uniref:Uncharacterized protein n=1 Tax=Prorocentrum cordatum TaxID=2364126 RepID=A0ABN9WDS3_9DINO|nr:unnamed protein product [Polarella glacialis]